MILLDMLDFLEPDTKITLYVDNEAVCKSILPENFKSTKYFGYRIKQIKATDFMEMEIHLSKAF